MKTDRKFPGVKITKKAEISIKNGHPWVYGEEITEGAQDILRMYSALIDILIAHEIPYEVVFSDYIGNKLWENELMAGFEMTDKTMSDVEN
jgi:hypothetical protein